MTLDDTGFVPFEKIPLADTKRGFIRCGGCNSPCYIMSDKGMKILKNCRYAGTGVYQDNETKRYYAFLAEKRNPPFREETSPGVYTTEEFGKGTYKQAEIMRTYTKLLVKAGVFPPGTKVGIYQSANRSEGMSDSFFLFTMWQTKDKELGKKIPDGPYAVYTSVPEMEHMWNIFNGHQDKKRFEIETRENAKKRVVAYLTRLKKYLPGYDWVMENFDEVIWLGDTGDGNWGRFKDGKYYIYDNDCARSRLKWVKEFFRRNKKLYSYLRKQ